MVTKNIERTEKRCREMKPLGEYRTERSYRCQQCFDVAQVENRKRSYEKKKIKKRNKERYLEKIGGSYSVGKNKEEKRLDNCANAKRYYWKNKEKD